MSDVKIDFHPLIQLVKPQYQKNNIFVNYF